MILIVRAAHLALFSLARVSATSRCTSTRAYQTHTPLTTRLYNSHWFCVGTCCIALPLSSSECSEAVTLPLGTRPSSPRVLSGSIPEALCSSRTTTCSLLWYKAMWVGELPIVVECAALAPVFCKESSGERSHGLQRVRWCETTLCRAAYGESNLWSSLIEA
jgi:hypothetical protein